MDARLRKLLFYRNSTSGSQLICTVASIFCLLRTRLVCSRPPHQPRDYSFEPDADSDMACRSLPEVFGDTFGGSLTIRSVEVRKLLASISKRN